MTMPDGATDVGLALLIILILVRDIIVPLVKGDPVSRVADELQKMNRQWEMRQSKLDDLHKWHSPNEQGQQHWRAHGLVEMLGRLFSIIQDLRGDIMAKLDSLVRDKP